MKKYKKVIPIVIAFIIGISTTVTAATVFNSKDITYSSTATTKKNVKDSLDELYTKVNTPWKCADGYVCYRPLADQVKIGDYISMTPTSTSYTISKDLTGYTSDQTINPSELSLWRVIKKNDDGTVDMVSDKVSSTLVYFRGKEGYINLVGGLNTIASQYTDGKHVASTRHIGYSNQTETITSTSKLAQTTVPWTKSTSEPNTWTGCSTSSYLCGTDESLGAGDIGYETDYNLVNAVYGNMIGKNPSGTATEYWLASRKFNYTSNSTWAFFGRCVNTDGGLFSNYLYIYMSGSNTGIRRYAVRPIVTLKYTVGIKSGSGTSSSPYVLN